MTRLSDDVRRLVGLENLLLKARRRYSECERELGAESERAARYRRLIDRLGEELHSAGPEQLQAYLAYVEQELTPRISKRVEAVKAQMLAAARRIVEGRLQLQELRAEYTDALERSRSLRERLGLQPFQALEVSFGLGVHPPHADRTTREAHDLVKEYLKS